MASTFVCDRSKKRNRGYEANLEQQEAIANVARWLVNSKNHFGLVLNGITGNGKTTLVKAMRSFFNVCKIKDPVCEEGESLSPNAGIWFETSRELYHLYSSNRKRFEMCRNTYILAIDDFGTEESDFASMETDTSRSKSCCPIATTGCSRPF